MRAPDAAQRVSGAEPGPTFDAEPRGSRLCGASFHAAPRPGHGSHQAGLRVSPFARLLPRRNLLRPCFCGMPDMFETLTFRRVVVSARVIMDGAGVIAVGGAVGAGEVFYRVSQISVGVAQSLGRAGVAEAARGRKLDLHQPDGAATP